MVTGEPHEFSLRSSFNDQIDGVKIECVRLSKLMSLHRGFNKQIGGVRTECRKCAHELLSNESFNEQIGLAKDKLICSDNKTGFLKIAIAKDGLTAW